MDAAVAVGFALAVVEPGAGNIGGGGFMLIRQSSGQTAFVDYRETAPRAASRNMYVAGGGKSDAGDSRVGYRAVAVPGTVAGLALALKTYGTLPLAQVMQPAIRLAEQGFPAPPALTDSLHDDAAKLSRFAVTKRIFLKGGAEYKTGELFRQPELAATLKRIASNGPDEFYRGETAHHLAEDMKNNGGLISLEDLAAYTPKIREPLRATYHYRGHEWQLITSPPPSSGGIAMIEALNILDPIELKNWDDAQSVHWMAEAMRRAFADRAAWLGDPDFVKVPLAGMRLEDLRAISCVAVSPTRAPRAEIRPGQPERYDESDQTTHFSIVDSDGNAVANTYTLNVPYGSGLVAEETGVLLNDELDDFAAKPGAANVYGLMGGDANAPGPMRRPVSSITPTLVFKGRQDRARHRQSGRLGTSSRPSCRLSSTSSTTASMSRKRRMRRARMTSSTRTNSGSNAAFPKTLCASSRRWATRSWCASRWARPTRSRARPTAS